MIANIYRGFPGMVHTGAARAGVENMTMTLAVEWAQFGILVNAVAPGIIISSGTAQYPPQLLERGIAKTPLKRAGTVEEVAASIVFLASPARAVHHRRDAADRRRAGAVGPHLGDPVNLGLAGKACLVAGASRGIGRAIAHALAREGATRRGDRARRARVSTRDAGCGHVDDRRRRRDRRRRASRGRRQRAPRSAGSTS